MRYMFLEVQRSEVQNAPRIGLWRSTRACLQANVASALSTSIFHRAKHQTIIMAEQLPNGDAPISTDVEMKEEPVAEV